MNRKDGPCQKDASIGGQAVIEGVMMRGERSFAVAVRRPGGDISVKREIRPRWTKQNFFLGLPFVRGMVTLAETLSLGIESLTYSAVESGEESEKLSKGEMRLSLALGIALSIALFIALPAFAFSRLKALPIDTLTLNLIEGSIRIAIFVGFLSAINLMPDMRRVFEYHGAEHKSIIAYEKLKKAEGFRIEDLTPETAESYSKVHPSCGTSFLLMVLLISILTFSFLGRPPFLLRIALKLLLLPIIAGVSYEIIRFARKNDSSLIVRIISLPGLMLQKLTTREPDRKQLEVAIAALKAAL